MQNGWLWVETKIQERDDRNFMMALCQNFCKFQGFPRIIISFLGLAGGVVKFQEFLRVRSKFQEFPGVKSKFQEFSRTPEIPETCRNPKN